MFILNLQECKKTTSLDQDLNHLKPNHDNIFRMFYNSKTKPKWYLEYEKINEHNNNFI